MTLGKRAFFAVIGGGILALAAVLVIGARTSATPGAPAGDHLNFAPGLAADSAPTSTPGSRTITLADDGGTVQMHPGDSFLLALGDTESWAVDVADPSILSRVVNITVVRGAQGVYEAHHPGTTVLTATGTAVCAEGVPCPLYARLFRLTVVVG